MEKNQMDILANPIPCSQTSFTNDSKDTNKKQTHEASLSAGAKSKNAVP